MRPVFSPPQRQLRGVPQFVYCALTGILALSSDVGHRHTFRRQAIYELTISEPCLPTDQLIQFSFKDQYKAIRSELRDSFSDT